LFEAWCVFLNPRFSKRQWFVIKWIYPPLQWATGAVLIAWLGVLDMELFHAFILGFIVGLVHDLGLVILGVGKWGDHYQAEDLPTEESDQISNT
jgi:hypothetical protein